MAEPFEYAIKKDVRNNPIVREVDSARHRELWKTVAVAGLFVVILLSWAWQQFDILRHGYRLEEMQRQRAAEEETARQLRLEIEMLTAQKRMREVAQEKLPPVAPPGEGGLGIERGGPAEPPARWVIAQR